MSTGDDQLISVFFSRFASDTSRFLVPRVPFTDDALKRQVIDYAIVSRDPSMPRIAILIRPRASQMNPEKQRELALLITSLASQNWKSIVFSPDDVEFRPKYVKEMLEDLLTGGQPANAKMKKRTFATWLKEYCYYTPLVKLKNMDVLLFAGFLVLIFSFSILAAMDKTDETKAVYSGRLHARSDEAVNTQRKKQVADRQASNPAHQKRVQFRVVRGERVPVINLDVPLKSDSKNHDADDLEEKSKDEMNQEPLYQATVRYCPTGIQCELKNKLKIELWGVSLPQDAQIQAEAMASINDMLSGNQIVFEKRKVLPDRMVVKAFVADMDVAQVQVESGYLIPNEDGDPYRPMLGSSLPK